MLRRAPLYNLYAPEYFKKKEVKMVYLMTQSRYNAMRKDMKHQEIIDFLNKSLGYYVDGTKSITVNDKQTGKTQTIHFKDLKINNNHAITKILTH
jgi:hypothetical protein